MTFKYEDYFDVAPSTGYETLIYDCMIGDAILYPRADGIEAGWRIVQPFMDAWAAANGNGLAIYRAGSDGPARSRLAAVVGRPPLARDRLKSRAMGTDSGRSLLLETRRRLPKRLRNG